MDQSAIFKISDNGTFELAAAVIDVPRTECALKILVLIPESFRSRRSQLPKKGAV